MLNTSINYTLFPAPSQYTASSKKLLLPRARAGISIASVKTLQELLMDNHERWHTFHLHRFHNHLAHTALTLWSLGADSAILRSSYEHHSTYQSPQIKSPGPITNATWKDHLGDDKYYQAYLAFFEVVLKSKSFSEILEEYIFTPTSNFVEGEKKKPQMVSRFVDGLVHPLIHTGLGIQFSLPGTFAEGIAQTAVHNTESTGVIPSHWFDSTVKNVESTSKDTGIKDSGSNTDVHAFSILARILADPTLGDAKAPDDLFEELLFYPEAVESHGEAIIRYVNQWTLDGDLELKVKELLWVNALIYGVGGSGMKDQFNADFFLMHFVTSSLFVSEILLQLKRESQIVLLRSYFSVCLGWYISRGRPNLDIATFFSNPDTLHPTPPGTHPTPAEGVMPSPSAPAALTPNPWLPILQSVLTHPDDHFAKLIRALIEYSVEFGLTPAGTFKNTELKNAELIDGTLFIRTAGLTLSRLGWVREGEAPGLWNMNGFYA